MKELIKAIQEAISGSVAAVNSALVKLPPVEQFEANQELGWGLRDMRACGANLIDGLNRLSEKLNGKIPEAMNAEISKTVAAQITAGELVKKADHEALLISAKAGAASEAEVKVTAQFQRQIKANEQRSTLLKDIPVAIAAKISDDVLLADDAPATVAKFKERLTALEKVNVTAENSAAFLSDVAGIPFNAEGDALFAEQKLKPLQVAFSASKAPAKPGAPNNPLAGAPKPGPVDGDPAQVRRRLL